MQIFKIDFVKTLFIHLGVLFSIAIVPSTQAYQSVSNFAANGFFDSIPVGTELGDQIQSVVDWTEENDIAVTNGSLKVQLESKSNQAGDYVMLDNLVVTRIDNDDFASQYAPAGRALDVSFTGQLNVPCLSAGVPSAGKRVLVTAAEYLGTAVYHTIYLPDDWVAGRQDYPIIFEYTGNAWSPGGSTGKVKDAHLGYGYTQGKYIWVSLPYIKENGLENEVTWWGDESATIDYAKVNVPKIIQSYGADPDAVFLVGFSRGAIGVNFLGLSDDSVAGLWNAFAVHDHFDGAKEWPGTLWGAPYIDYRAGAIERLQRIQGRPYLVTSVSTTVTQNLVEDALPSSSNFSYLPTDMSLISNLLALSTHNDTWMQVDSQYRSGVWSWFNSVVAQ